MAIGSAASLAASLAELWPRPETWGTVPNFWGVFSFEIEQRSR
jgi:hypothetical protein